LEKENQSGAKKVLKYIYRDIFLTGCGIFAVILNLLMLLLYTVFEEPIILSKNVLLLFAFAMTFSLVNQIFKIKSNLFLKIGVHFVLSSSVIALFFFVINKFVVDNKTSVGTIVLVTYIVAYLIFLPFYLYFKIKSERKQKEEGEYKSLYKK